MLKIMVISGEMPQNIAKNIARASLGVDLLKEKVTQPLASGDEINLQNPIRSFLALERYNSLRLVHNIHNALAALSRVSICTDSFMNSTNTY